MPSRFLFDSVATLAEGVTVDYDALGRPVVAEAPERTYRCRVSSPTAADLDAGRDGKHVIEAVLFFPLGAVVQEADRIVVNEKTAQMVAPAVLMRAPSGMSYLKVPVRWVADAS